MKKRVPNYFKLLIGILVGLTILVLATLLSKINSLDIKSDEVQNLYSFLGDEYLDYCGGMPLYISGEVTPLTLDDNTKMCLAYKQLNNKQKSSENISKYKKKDYCTVNATKIRLDKENDYCVVETFSLKTFNKAYGTIFKDEMPTLDEFALSDEITCIFEEEKGSYVCGAQYVQTIELGWAPTTYRMIASAKQKGDKIYITDYFLAINNDRCYIANDGKTENKECSKKINSKTKYKSRFVAKNGQKFIHTFAQDKNGNYYWESTTPTK